MSVKTKKTVKQALVASRKKVRRAVSRTVGNFVLTIEDWNEPGVVYIGLSDIRFHRNCNDSDPLIEFFFQPFSRSKAAWQLHDFLWKTQILERIVDSPSRDEVIHAAVDGILEIMP